MCNENMNGLLRRFFPKRRGTAAISQNGLDFALQHLNDRPRKCMDFKTTGGVS